MAEEVHHPDGSIEHPSVRHERTDASFRAIVYLLVGAMAFAALVFFVLLVFFYDYRDYQKDIKKSPYPLARTPMTALPPKPQLEQLERIQGYQEANVFKRQLSAEETLNRYGPTAQDGFVHIPIAQAIARLENKLPVREKLPDAGQRRRAGGLVNAGASSSGRMFREKP
jgi:hypothetical protein